MANYLWAYDEKFQFHYSVAYSASVECKTGNNTGIIGNLKRIIG